MVDVQPLLGIEVQAIEKPEESERVAGTVQALWKMLEYRRRLTEALTPEQAWLGQLETATRTRVQADLNWLKPRLSEENYSLLAECATRFIDSEGSVDEEQLVSLLESLLNTSPKQETAT